MTARVDAGKPGGGAVREGASSGGHVPSSGGREGVSVMLVDDERALTEEIAEVLCAERIDVMLASDGLEAFSLAERHLPSLIIVDKNMPGISGLGLVRNLRALPGGGGLHILMMSAFFTPEERAEGERLGVNRFLEKPFDLDQVVDWVLERLGADPGSSSTLVPPSMGLDGRVAVLEAQVARLEQELRHCRDLLGGSVRRSGGHGDA